MIGLRHPLAVLSSHMPWQDIEASLAHRFERQVRAGKKLKDVDLFCSNSAVVGVDVSRAGRPRLPLRMMVSLLYLRHAHNESDSIHAVLCAAGYNIRWLLRMIRKKGVGFLLSQLPAGGLRWILATISAGFENVLLQTRHRVHQAA